MRESTDSLPCCLPLALCLVSLLVDALASFCALPHKASAPLDVCMCVHLPLCLRASCLVRMDGAESALEVLRMTSERATNLMDWGQLPNWEAKTAEAKALYEDLLPRMERELVR